MKQNLLTFLIFISLVACNVEKRKYQKGFYISNSGKVKINAEHITVARAILPPDSCDILVFSDGTKISGKIASVGNKDIQYTFCNDRALHKIPKQRLLSVEKPNGVIEYFDGRPTVIPPPSPVATAPTVLPKSDSIVTSNKEVATNSVTPSGRCETIFMRNGDEISAKVIEVGVTEVRFKLCTMPDGPDFIKSKSDIFMIRYTDGTKDVFKESAPVIPDVPREQPKSNNNSLSVLSLTFSILGIYPLTILGSLVGLITGIIYLRKNPFEAPGSPSRKRAVAGVIISSVILILFGLLLAFFVL